MLLLVQSLLLAQIQVIDAMKDRYIYEPLYCGGFVCACVGLLDFCVV